jgi:nicotinic acid mononucleotide adenylyltransferase
MTYPRPGFSVERNALLAHWESHSADRLLASLLQFPLSPLSSTRIREQIRNHGRVGEDVNEDVASYIERYNLYGQVPVTPTQES